MTAIPRSHVLAFLLLAAGGCLADLASKSWIFAWLGMPGMKPSYWLIDEIFGFTTSLNEGALFGVGQGQVVFFTVLSLLAGLGILYWLFIVGTAHERLPTVAMGCVMAGILGNLYDRVGLPGLRWHIPHAGHQVGDPVFAVRDWLHFKIDALHFDWPIFNIADSLLVCGVALLMWHVFTTESPTAPAVPQPESAETT